MSGNDISVVLVHGAWADGSSWSKVVGGLRKNGIKAVTVPVPLTTLADDVAALDRTLDRVEGPVVLVGHAYAGAAPDTHGLIWLPQDSFAAAFAQNASAEEQAVLAAVQRPISPACISVPLGRPLWKGLPSWYLLAEQDRMIAVETQRFMAERMKARVSAHPVDHTPSVTAPGPVVELILKAVGEARA